MSSAPVRLGSSGAARRPLEVARDIGPRGLRVAFAGGNGFPPEDSGGVQSSTDDLARRLLSRGHRPSVLAPLYGSGRFGLAARARLKLSGNALVRDTYLGYPAYRGWFPEREVADFVTAASPDVAVVQCHGTFPIARAFREAGVPVVVYLRNVEFEELGGDLSGLSGVSYIANSNFTAGRYRERFGIEATVIPPTIDMSRYEVKSDNSFVTLINPVAEKGVERAIEIAARCPEIPFLFVESWLLGSAALADLTRAIRPYPNIRFERRTEDVRSVYGRTRVLLAPSRWEEAWGRVASEAHCSGIPVIGSDRGGLPEAIGPGGIVLGYDAPLEDWLAAVRELWFDEARHASVSAMARLYAGRPEVDPDKQYRVFMSVIRHAIEQEPAK